MGLPPFIYLLEIKMLDNIEYNLKTWDWKSQTIWKVNEEDEALLVPVLIGRLERWYYQTKEVEIDLSVINLSNYSFTTNDLFDFMTHYKLVENADLKYPVILNRRWIIIDWRHRLCKSILQGKKKLKWIMILDSDVY